MINFVQICMINVSLQFKKMKNDEMGVKGNGRQGAIVWQRGGASADCLSVECYQFSVKMVC